MFYCFSDQDSSTASAEMYILYTYMIDLVYIALVFKVCHFSTVYIHVQKVEFPQIAHIINTRTSAECAMVIFSLS